MKDIKPLIQKAHQNFLMFVIGIALLSLLAYSNKKMLFGQSATAPKTQDSLVSVSKTKLDSTKLTKSKEETPKKSPIQNTTTTNSTTVKIENNSAPVINTVVGDKNTINYHEKKQ